MHSIQALFAFSPTSSNMFFVAQPEDTIFETALEILYWPAAQRPSVISFSYTFGDSDLGYPNTQRSDMELIQLGLMGVTVVVASGDDGAVSGSNPTCLTNLNSYGYGIVTNTAGPILPQYPASSPYVLTVGETDFLRTNLNFFDYSVTSPPCCSNCGQLVTTGNPIVCQSQSGGEQVVSSTNANNLPISTTSGGGFSQYAPTPAWQRTAVSSYLSTCAVASAGCPLPPSNYFNRSNRAYPDLSLFGGYFPAVINGAESQISGTSVAAPLMAAIIVRLNEVAVARTGTTLGFFNPTLYAMVASQPNTCNDLTTGTNICARTTLRPTNCLSKCSGFTAAVGFDPVTGLGSPNVGNMQTWLSANLPATTAPAPSTGTCQVNISFPTTSYPYLAGFVAGSLTYDKVSSHSYTAPGYPTGYQILSFSGTRTVLQATSAAPTVYSQRSSVPFILSEVGDIAPASAYDNVIYLDCSVPAHADSAGWGLALSANQPQVYVSGLISSGGPTYYFIKLFSTSTGGQLTDAFNTSLPFSSGGLFTQLTCDGVPLCGTTAPAATAATHSSSSSSTAPLHSSSALSSSASSSIPSSSMASSSTPSSSIPSSSAPSSSIPSSSIPPSSIPSSPSTAASASTTSFSLSASSTPVTSAGAPSTASSSLPSSSSTTPASPGLSSLTSFGTSLSVLASSTSSAPSFQPSSTATSASVTSPFRASSATPTSDTAVYSSSTVTSLTVGTSAPQSSVTSSALIGPSAPSSLSSAGSTVSQTCGSFSPTPPLGSAAVFIVLNGSWPSDCTALLNAMESHSAFPIAVASIGATSPPQQSAVIVEVSSNNPSPVLPIIGGWRSALVNASSSLSVQLAALGYQIDSGAVTDFQVITSCPVNSTTFQTLNYCDTGAGYTPGQCATSSALSALPSTAIPGSLLTSLRLQVDLSQLPTNAEVGLQTLLTSQLGQALSALQVVSFSAQPLLYSDISMWGVCYATLLLLPGNGITPSSLLGQLEVSASAVSSPLATALQLAGFPMTQKQEPASALTVCADGSVQCSCPTITGPPTSSSSSSSSTAIIAGVVGGVVGVALLLCLLCALLMLYRRGHSDTKERPAPPPPLPRRPPPQLIIGRGEGQPELELQPGWGGTAV